MKLRTLLTDQDLQTLKHLYVHGTPSELIAYLADRVEHTHRIEQQVNRYLRGHI